MASSVRKVVNKIASPYTKAFGINPHKARRGSTVRNLTATRLKAERKAGIVKYTRGFPAKHRVSY